MIMTCVNQVAVEPAHVVYMVEVPVCFQASQKIAGVASRQVCCWQVSILP